MGINENENDTLDELNSIPMTSKYLEAFRRRKNNEMKKILEEDADIKLHEGFDEPLQIPVEASSVPSFLTEENDPPGEREDPEEEPGSDSADQSDYGFDDGLEEDFDDVPDIGSDGSDITADTQEAVEAIPVAEGSLPEEAAAGAEEETETVPAAADEEPEEPADVPANQPEKAPADGKELSDEAADAAEVKPEEVSVSAEEKPEAVAVADSAEDHSDEAGPEETAGAKPDPDSTEAAPLEASGITNPSEKASAASRPAPKNPAVSASEKSAKEKETKVKASGEVQNRQMYIALTTLLVFAFVFLVFVIIRGSSTGSGMTVAPDTAASYEDAQNSSENASSSPVSSEEVSSVSSEPVSSKPVSSQPAYRPLKFGEKSDDVKNMQLRLCELGYMNKASCTGYYGDFTTKIVKFFQTNANITVTGEADAETLALLYSDDAPYSAR